jgi:predicted GNAT family acetyltransferase
MVRTVDSVVAAVASMPLTYTKTVGLEIEPIGRIVLQVMVVALTVNTAQLMPVDADAPIVTDTWPGLVPNIVPTMVNVDAGVLAVSGDTLVAIEITVPAVLPTLRSTGRILAGA